MSNPLLIHWLPLATRSVIGYIVLDVILPKFKSEFISHQELSIDESMIPLQGRMKDRPTKWCVSYVVLGMVRFATCRFAQVRM